MVLIIPGIALLPRASFFRDLIIVTRRRRRGDSRSRVLTSDTARAVRNRCCFFESSRSRESTSEDRQDVVQFWRTQEAPLSSRPGSRPGAEGKREGEVTVVHPAVPLRLIMQFSDEAFFIVTNNRGYSRRARLVRHPICISRAPFRGLHSAGAMFLASERASKRERDRERERAGRT